MSTKEKYGEWALITGASSGIGEGFARRLASEKINLILVARRKDRLEKLSEELKVKHGIDTLIAQIDLAKPDFMTTLSSLIGIREVGLLINNAGFGFNGYFGSGDAERQAAMIQVNCIAPTILTHHFASLMKKRRKGAIIFLGSIVGCIPTPFTTTYSATKAFNIFMGEGLWYELKDYNIDVLTLNPGGTATEFQKVANTSAGPVPRTVEQVVDTAMRNLGRSISVVDGIGNKLLAFIPRLLTRKMTVSLAGKVRTKYYSSASPEVEKGT